MNLVVPALTPEPWVTAPALWQRGPSLHLSWLELHCHDGTEFPIGWRRGRAVPLSAEFECVRATISGHAGRAVPVKIGSAYRTAEWNRLKKGTKNSTHVEGIALDLWTPPGMPLLDLLDAVLVVSKRPGGRIRGIGVYPWGVHLDIREGSRIARWKGSRVSPEVEERLNRA